MAVLTKYKARLASISPTSLMVSMQEKIFRKLQGNTQFDRDGVRQDNVNRQATSHQISIDKERATLEHHLWVLSWRNDPPVDFRHNCGKNSREVQRTSQHQFNQHGMSFGRGLHGPEHFGGGQGATQNQQYGSHQEHHHASKFSMNAQGQRHATHHTNRINNHGGHSPAPVSSQGSTSNSISDAVSRR